MAPRVHFFQHAPHEGLGALEELLWTRGSCLSRTAWWQENPQLPPAEDLDLLIIMGGPMGVYETSQYPWIPKEIQFIQTCIQLKKPILGICLGSQLLASALGAEVYPSGKKEIGWFALQPADSTLPAPWALPAEVQKVFHWHGDTFTLPPGARLLWSSQATPHQGVLAGDRFLGLQFHLEVDRPTLNAFIQSGAAEMVPGPWVQSPADAQQDEPVHSPACTRWLETLLDYLLTL